jgi:hypothetical protein
LLAALDHELFSGRGGRGGNPVTDVVFGALGFVGAFGIKVIAPFIFGTGITVLVRLAPGIERDFDALRSDMAKALGKLCG